MLLHALHRQAMHRKAALGGGVVTLLVVLFFVLAPKDDGESTAVQYDWLLIPRVVVGLLLLAGVLLGMAACVATIGTTRYG